MSTVRVVRMHRSSLDCSCQFQILKQHRSLGRFTHQRFEAVLMLRGTSLRSVVPSRSGRCAVAAHSVSDDVEMSTAARVHDLREQLSPGTKDFFRTFLNVYCHEESLCCCVEVCCPIDSTSACERGSAVAILVQWVSSPRVHTCKPCVMVFCYVNIVLLVLLCVSCSHILNIEH